MPTSDDNKRIKKFLRKHPPLDSPPGRRLSEARKAALRIIDRYPKISSIEFWRLMGDRGFPISKEYARQLKKRALGDWVFLSRSGKHISIPVIKKGKLKSFDVKAWWDKDYFSPFNGVLVTDFIFKDSVNEVVIEGILMDIRGLCVRDVDDGRHVVCWLPFEVHASGLLMGNKVGRHIGFRVPFRFAGVSRTCFAFFEESEVGGFSRFVVFDRSRRHFGTEQIEFDSLESAAFFFRLLFEGYRGADLFARLRVREVVGFHGRGHKTKTLYKESLKRS